MPPLISDYTKAVQKHIHVCNVSFFGTKAVCNTAWQTHCGVQLHCLVPAFTWHKLDPLLRNQLISLACLYSTAVILTSLQDHENPHQVQSRREDGSHGSPEVLRKVLKNKEPGVRVLASSFELAGAQSTCKPLCAVKILLHLQYLWYKPEAGDMYRFNHSENKHNTSRHYQYLCPIPGLFSLQIQGCHCSGKATTRMTLIHFC